MAMFGRLPWTRWAIRCRSTARLSGPPYHYRNAQAISIKFETDLEAALEALPAPLELIEPATANLSFYWYPFTTFGPYHEAILRLYARHAGERLTYIHQIFVDTEPPMLAGREIWGFPKKMATIGLQRERDMICGTLERPSGVRLATMVFVRSSRSPTCLPAARPQDCGSFPPRNPALRVRRSPNWSPPTPNTPFVKPGKERGRFRFPIVPRSIPSIGFRCGGSSRRHIWK